MMSWCKNMFISAAVLGCSYFGSAGAAYGDVTGLDYINSGTGVFASADAMTLDPSATHSMSGAGDDYNFGASGSISIASASASAYSADEGIDDDPKGLFRCLMSFDTSIFAGQQLSDIAISMYTNNGNAGAKGLFNVRGHSGDVDVYWVTNNWIEGDGLPLGTKTVYGDDYTTTPITDNGLDRLLDETLAVPLTSFTYDGLAAYGTLTWYTWSLAAALDNAAFAEALYEGQEVSLLFAPSWIDENNDGVNDNLVSFNFISHRSETEGAVFSFTAVPEPMSIFMLAVSAAALRRKR